LVEIRTLESELNIGKGQGDPLIVKLQKN